MKLRIAPTIVSLLALAASSLTASAAPAAQSKASEPVITLKLGDAAPTLATGKWVQGEPMKAFDREHAYLVEFWATWCGPCKAAIPHLNELHTKFKDRGLVVIGQNVWENSESAVGPFVKQMGDKMTYRVALDDKSGGGKGRMADTWLKAAGKNGIPASFLVDKKGTIVWIGHPMNLEESMIEAVLAGRFDAKQGSAKEQDQAAARAKTTELMRNATTAIKASDWAKAEEAIDSLDKELPRTQRFVAGAMRIEMLCSQGKQEDAAKVAEKLAAESKGNPLAQNLFATRLAATPDSKPATLDAAERIATRASEEGGGNDIMSLVTLARIAFLKGNQAKAVEIQTKVVDLSKPIAKPRMQEFLDAYKAGKLPERRSTTTTTPAPAK